MLGVYDGYIIRYDVALKGLMKVEWCHVTSGVKDVVPQAMDNGCYEGFEDLVDSH